MKKNLLILGCLLSFFYATQVAEATSGACSYNGGVNCAAGPAIDGNAICNDGSESSTLYSQTDECSVNACSEAHVVSEFSQYINLPAHIRKTLFQLNANLINQLTQAKNTAIQALQQSNAIVPQQLSNSPCLAVAIELQNDMQQAENACSVKYGSNAVTGNYLSSCICASGYEWNTTKTQCVVIPNCPTNSSDVLGVCTANAGYISYNGQYISYTDYCHQIYGNNATNNTDGSCSCQGGYKWNQGKTTCVPIPTTLTLPVTHITHTKKISPKTVASDVITPISIPINDIHSTLINSNENATTTSGNQYSQQDWFLNLLNYFNVSSWF